MALYRSVLMGFWTDTKVVDEFTPEDRYFYLYLFTNPHTNLCGCYELSIKQAADELGYSRDTTMNLLSRFEKVHKVIRYSAETKEVLLLNWHKYNWTKSDKFISAVNTEIGKVKDSSFKQYLLEVLCGDDTVSIPYPYGMDTTNANAITNTVTDTKRKIFKKPTLDDVKAYCRERGNAVDPEAFIDFYESKGWRVGNQHMKDWKAAVRTWEKREKLTPKKRQPSFKDQRSYDYGSLEQQLLGGAT